MNNLIKKLFIFFEILIIIFFTYTILASPIDEYVSMLRSNNPRTQIEAANELRNLSDPHVIKAVVPLINLLLKTEDVEVKRAVAWALEIGDERAVKPLLSLLNLPDEELKENVVYALACISNRGNYPEIIPNLIPLLEDKNWRIRSSAITILSNFGESIVPEMQKLIFSESALLRENVARVLGNIYNSSALESLIILTNDHDTNVRKAAVVGIGKYQEKMKDREGLKTLIYLLENKYPDIRIEAIGASAKLKYKSLYNRLILALEDKDINVRRTMAEILAGKGGYNSCKLINKCIYKLNKIIDIAITDSDWQVRRDIALALGEVNNKGTVECLEYLSNNDVEPKVRKEAVRSLGKIGSESSVPVLIEVISNNDRDVQAEAIRSLGKIESEEAVKFLITLLNNQNLREYAIRSLGEQKNKLAVEPLLELLKDEGKEIKAIIHTLGEIKDERCILPLLKMLDSRDNKIRIEVIYALGKFSNPKITLAMINLLSDKDIQVKKAATSILGKNRYVDSEIILKLKEIMDSDDIDARKYASQVFHMLTGVNYQYSKKLTEIAEENFIEISKLQTIIEKGGLSEKRDAIQKLFGINDLRVIKILLPYIRDKDFKLRGLAIQAITGQITRIRHPFYGTLGEIEILHSAEKELINLLFNKEIEIFHKKLVINTLGVMKSKAAIEYLIKIVKRPVDKGNLKIESIKSIGNIGDLNTTSFLIGQLKESDDETIKVVLLESLAQIGGDESLKAIEDALNDKSDAVRGVARILWYKAMGNTLEPDKFEKLKVDMDAELALAREMSQNCIELFENGDFPLLLETIDTAINLYEQIAVKYPNKYDISQTEITNLRLLKVGYFKRVNNWQQIISEYKKIIESGSQRSPLPFYLFYIAKIYETKIMDYNKALSYYQDVIRQVEDKKYDPDIGILHIWLDEISQYTINNVMQKYMKNKGYSPKTIKIKFPCLEFDTLYSPQSMYAYILLQIMSINIDNENNFTEEGLIDERFLRRTAGSYEAMVMSLVNILQLEQMVKINNEVVKDLLSEGCQEDAMIFMKYKSYINSKNKYEKTRRDFIKLYPEDLESIIIRLKMAEYYDEIQDKKMAGEFSEEAKVVALKKDIILVIGPDKRFLTPESTWETYRLAVSKGNIDSLLECFTPHAQSKYREIFKSLGIQEMKKAAKEIQQINPISREKEKAEYIIVRKEEGEDYGYFIYFYKIYDEWKIAQF